MAAQILLLLGAGKNIGLQSIKKFKDKGWQVAAVSRKPLEEIKSDADLVIPADFVNPRCIAGIFETVKQKLGIPNLVIYNAYTATMGTEFQRALSVPLDGLIKDFNVNTFSAYAAAQQAVEGFGQLPSSVHKTFIYTGNKGNVVVLPQFLSLAATKEATWYMIQCAVASYKDLGYRFYYVDQRSPDGSYTDGRESAKEENRLDGNAHSEFFLELANRDDQGPANATFIKGKGYVEFEKTTKEVMLLPPNY